MMVGEKFSFTIDGEPKAKARPRIGKGGSVFTPKPTVSYENWVKTCFINQGGTFFPDEYFSVHIVAEFSIPKSIKNKKKREEMANGKIFPTKKPDLDNIAKIILDSLNKIAYSDDSHVISLSVIKRYSEVPKVKVIFHELDFL